MANPNIPPGPGRPKGSKTMTVRIREMFESMGYDPVYELAKMSQDPKLDRKTKVLVDRECAKYYAPQLRAIEVTGEDGSPFSAPKYVIVTKSLKEGDEG